MNRIIETWLGFGDRERLLQEMRHCGAKVINIKEIGLLYPNTSGSPFGHKPIAVSKYLNDVTKNTCIVNPVATCADYNVLLSLLDPSHVKLLGGLFILPSTKNEAYEKLWRDHSRWLDYPPEHVRKLTADYIGELLAIAAAMRAAGVEVDVRYEGEA